MTESTKAVVQAYYRLTSTERLEFAKAVDLGTITPSSTKKSGQVEKGIPSMNVGPIRQDVCPRCGK